MSSARQLDAQAPGKANILVVDDLPEKLLVFQSILEELGQNLVLAHSGSEALQQVLQREFAVILLDVNMPDIDGMETAALIRQYKRSAHTPIIFITAHADEMQTAQGYSLGAVDYMLSPILPEVLRSKVRVFVDLYQMQQRTRLMAEERVALARAEAARSVAEENNRRSEFLSRASRELGASLDVEEGMRRLLDLLVPQMAELAIAVLDANVEACTLFMRTLEGGGPRTSSVQSFAELPEVFAQVLCQVLAKGEPVASESGPDGGVPLPRPAHRALGLPLRTGTRTIGAVLVATRVGMGAFSERDVSLLQEFASRAAMALDNAMLYRKVQQEIAHSRQAEEKLQDANRRKDEFLAMLSHELRNPLAPIRTAVEVMRRIGSSEPQLALARDVVERQVTHLSRLVDELLDVSRISQGKISLKKEPIELAQVLKHSIETERSLIEGRGQRLEVNLPAAPVWLFGDFSRLAQVMCNLLNNAAKYTDPGGLIEIHATANEGEAIVRVKDNGAGIDAQLLPRVFELFVQGERSLDRSQGGLGVGLTLVRRIVELHEGRIEVKSEGLGLGSEFKVVLPCVSAVRVQASAPKIAPVADSQSRRVLVVDDNADAAEAIALYLQIEGHVVKTALDGPQALAAARAFLPQVIVLDVGLPGLDGYEVARRLRQREEGRETLLIALTGYGQKEDRARAEAAGFDCHYVKPADPRDILQAIERGRMGVTQRSPTRPELKAS